MERTTSQETVEISRLKGANIQENELARKIEGITVVRTPRPKLAYSVTGKAKVAKKITEMGLLRRLKEVNIILTCVNYKS